MSDKTIITDKGGRKLTINRPDVLDESRLMRAMGDAAANGVYMNAYVLPTVFVTEIDGEKVAFPTSERQVEALISRLGRDGLNAVQQHIMELAQAEQDGEAALKN